MKGIDRIIPRAAFIMLFLTLVTSTTFGQEVGEKFLYVIDSIPIVEDPEEGDDLLNENDIETLMVVTNKAEIEKYGYKGLDKLFFIITKEYTKRPDAIKKIPTTKQMKREEGRWHLKDSAQPYNGPFIDYYTNGRKQGEGMLKEGVLDGIRTVFYQNGNKKYFRTYLNGVLDGESEDYFPNGRIHQKGSFKAGKNEGLWQDWYSGGDLKRETTFKNGDPILNEEEKKLDLAFKRAMKMFNEYNYTGAVKQWDKAIELSPRYSDLYFHRGTAYLNDFKFDEAISNFDKAIELEPLYMEAFSNRGFARLRKHEFKDSRTLKKSGGVTVLAGKSKVELPADELEKICRDLAEGIKLGDKNLMTLEAHKKYCE